MAISGATHEKTKMMMRNKDDDQKKHKVTVESMSTQSK